MARKIEIDLEEMKELYFLLEDYVSFFHNEDHYKTVEELNDFLNNGNYKKLHNTFYNVVWNWLPLDIQKEIAER